MMALSRRFLLLLLLAAFAVRLGGLAWRGELRVPPHVGAEAGAMAHALLEGRGYQTPFGNTSPSTHLPPAYPTLLAGVIGLQDALHLPGHGPRGSDATAYYVMLALNLAAGALLPVIAVKISEAAGFPRLVAVIAGAALCLCPEALRAASLVWDEAIFVTLAALLLWWIIRRATGPAPTARSAAGFGLANGALALLNPSLVLALPLAWVTVTARRLGVRPTLAQGMIIAALTILGGLPWHLRNWVLLDPPARVFVRGNFWLEVWSNLHPVSMATGTPQVVHPWAVNGTERLVRDGQPLTEQEYFAFCRERSLTVLGQPQYLATHVARQFNSFWLGLAEAQRWQRSPTLFFLAQGLPAILGILGWMLVRPRVAPAVLDALMMLLIVYPLPYYLAGGGARYRHPIDLVLYVGLGWAAWWVMDRKRARASVPATAKPN